MCVESQPLRSPEVISRCKFYDLVFVDAGVSTPPESGGHFKSGLMLMPGRMIMLSQPLRSPEVISRVRCEHCNTELGIVSQPLRSPEVISSIMVALTFMGKMSQPLRSPEVISRLLE